MKTLSVKQPWAYLLCAGIKDIENRTWKLPEKYKGERVLIHASAKRGDFWETPQRKIVHDEITKISISDYKTTTGLFSAIIGSVRFVDCVINHPSIWAERAKKDPWYEYIHGESQETHQIYNWVVADPILFDHPILGIKGKLGFWESYREPIICPNCGQIQCAGVEDTVPFMTYIHECDKCEYVIMESEWNKIN